MGYVHECYTISSPNKKGWFTSVSIPTGCSTPLAETEVSEKPIEEDIHTYHRPSLQDPVSYAIFCLSNRYLSTLFIWHPIFTDHQETVSKILFTEKTG
jgi:hypothetical protein